MGATRTRRTGAGDAYYYHGELQPDPAPAPPFLDSLQAAIETDHALRLADLHRLRRLASRHVTGVQIVSAHDPWEFRRYRSR